MTYQQRTRCVEPTQPALRTDMVAPPERVTRRRLPIAVADQKGSNYNVRVKALMYRSLAPPACWSWVFPWPRLPSVSPILTGSSLHGLCAQRTSFLMELF